MKAEHPIQQVHEPVEGQRMRAPLGYVIYECRAKYDPLAGKWRSHGHHVPFDQELRFSMNETIAETLADAVVRCNEGKQNGHGYTHDADEPELAYKAALEQVATKDYDAEWQELHQNIVAHKKWGGPVPKALLLPDPLEPSRMNLIMTDKWGNPKAYRVDDSRVRGLLPPPSEMGAVRDPYGMGWYLPPRRVRRRLQRRNGKEA